MGLGKKIILSAVLLCTGVLHAAPRDFDAAKTIAVKIHSDTKTDFYCNCPLRWSNGRGQIDIKSCGYQIRKNPLRATRVEWEHVMPAQQFGALRPCWKAGGRGNCEKTDAQFRLIEANLYNLKPALGEVNADRAHFRFAELPHTLPQHGSCPVRIDFDRQQVEPQSNIRGDIARIYFYMADRYHIALSEAEQHLFLAWHQQDPVDTREVSLMWRTAQYMGHPNEFVTGKKQWRLSAATGIEDDFRQTKTQLNQLSASTRQNDETATAVVGNSRSKKYHYEHCSGRTKIKQEHQRQFASAGAAQAAGYQLAGNCKPPQP